MKSTLAPIRLSEPSDESLRDRLRSVGILIARCDVEGQIEITDVPRDDWLHQLLLGSRFMHRVFKSTVCKWADLMEPSCEELIPGCWCLPVPITQRRKRIGYGIILLPTADLVGSEQFRALCQSAQVDYAFCRKNFSCLPAADNDTVSRLTQMAKFLFYDHMSMADAERTIESVGQQLAESYEEISLLYTISQSMTVVQHPRRFVLNACRGLLETMTYRWIGAQFIDEVEHVRSLSGKLLHAGDLSVEEPQLSSLTRRLLLMATADTPRVIDCAADPAFKVFAPLKCPILLHPISREDRLLGVWIAADKTADDRAASSADMKLLGATASHTSIFLENASLYEDMDAMFLGTLEAITASIDAKDRYTCGHSQRVALLSQQLAEAAGLDDDTVRRVHVAGLVHDVGKIGVPEAVLCKPGRLTNEEFEAIKQHPAIGYRILKDIPQLRDVLPGVLHHHERWDGKGYPHGLKGEEIPLYARLIALADSFDAMSSNRTYRSARDRHWVLDEIERSAGTQFDPELVPLFVKLEFTRFDQLIRDHRAVDAENRRHGRAA